MTGRFIDSNILLYLLQTDDKADIASSIVGQGGTISVQVLNECLSTIRRKTDLTIAECNRFLYGLRALLHVTPMTIETHDLGRAVSERYQLSVYDSMIVAAALLAGCTELFSEDMQHNLVIEDTLIIKNPMR